MTTFDTSDATTVSALYKEHHPWLRQWLRRQLGCSEVAADLAQETFVRLISRPRLLDSNPGVKAFLSTIAKGLCIDLWRRQEIERAWLDALAMHPELEASSPETRLLMLEALTRVDAMLRSLPEKVATAFMLSQLEGLTYREIAQRLDVSERMVKKYMAQAMLQCALIDAEYRTE